MRVIECHSIHAGEKSATVLSLDSEWPSGKWSKVRVKNEEHETLYMSGARFDQVAITGIHDFTGEEIEFV